MGNQFSGISTAAAIRVGHLLGSGNVPSAQRAAKLSVALILGFMALLAVAKLTLRNYIGLIFTQARAATPQSTT